MPRTTAAVMPFLAVLALALTGKAVAGPPEGVSGKMVVDKVAAGLEKYQHEDNPDKRIACLKKIAHTRDPRVGLELGSIYEDISFRARFCPDFLNPGDLRRLTMVEELLTQHFVEVGRDSREPVNLDWWWLKNHADLRHRAKQLPQ